MLYLERSAQVKMAFLIPALASLIPSAVDWLGSIFTDEEDYFDEDYDEEEDYYGDYY